MTPSRPQWMSILASDKPDKLMTKSKTPACARRAGVLNYAFLTLVGKGDTKSRHPEILIVAAVPGFELNRGVHNGGAGKGNPKPRGHALTVLGEKVQFVGVIPLAEDEVPGEVGHQPDVAGHAEFQSRADLAQRPDAIIVNRIDREEFLLMDNVTVGDEGALLIEKLVKR